MITKILISIHIILSILTIFLILIHKGKGSEIGASFGGGQDSILSNKASNSIIKKTIIIIAIVISINIIAISYTNKIKDINKENIINIENNYIPGIKK